MWRLKRADIPSVPDAVRVSIEPADDTAPPTLSAEALAAATCGPMPLTDAELVKRLQQELSAAKGTIGRLNEQLAGRPDPVSNCSGCVGYRQVIADLREEMRGLRRRFMELHLAAPGERDRTWAAPYAARED